MNTCLCISLNHSNRCSQKFTQQFIHESYITQAVSTKTIPSKTIIKLSLSECQPLCQPTWELQQLCDIKTQKYHSIAFINITYLGFYNFEVSSCIVDVINYAKAIGFKWKVKTVIVYTCIKHLLCSKTFWHMPSFHISCLRYQNSPVVSHKAMKKQHAHV